MMKSPAKPNQDINAIRVALKDVDRSDASNPKLLLHRYLHTAVANNDSFRDERKKLQGLLIQALPKTSGVYKKAYVRWSNGLNVDHIVSQVFVTQPRLIIGLGGEHVLETGLTLHHTYGVPIIYGSALKGLARHYCHQVWGQAGKEFEQFNKNGKHFRTLFGNAKHGGCLQFHDGWFSPDNLSGGLVHDVLTTHHEKYYGGGKEPPTDFDDPNPVPFLAVRGQFHIAVEAPKGHPSASKWAQLGMDLLTEALREWGIGGKTSSGYGRMAPVGGSSKGAGGPPAKPPKPRYKAGDSVEVKRVPDPKNKDRRWFEADDGFGGVVASGTPPNVEMGQTAKLKIAAANKDSYNFRLP